MTRSLLAGVCALALLAGCTAQQATTTTTALQAAAAVAVDIVQLEQQVQASGTNITPAEMAALSNALLAAQQGVVALANNPAAGATVFAKITAALQQVVPFIPAIAAVISTLGTPENAGAMAAATASYPALSQLQTDLAKLHTAR